MGIGQSSACYLPDGRLFVGAPHGLAWPRTTQDSPEFGSNSPSMFSVQAGQRGESMWVQPAFCISPGMPAQHAQPDIARGLYEVGGSGFPTYFPVGNRASETVHSFNSNHEGVRYLVVPPDRFNAQANHAGGNRRGAHDVRNNRPRPSRRGIPGVPVGA